MNSRLSCLQIRADVRHHPELYSQIFTPHPVVIPGGRFRELYYWWVSDEGPGWSRSTSGPLPSLASAFQTFTAGAVWPCRDTYWVINGLLLSEMTDTALGMIQNFVYLVNRWPPTPTTTSPSSSRWLASFSSIGVCVPPPADTASFPTVGAFTTSAAPSPRFWPWWRRATIRPPRTKSSSGDLTVSRGSFAFFSHPLIVRTLKYKRSDCSLQLTLRIENGAPLLSDVGFRATLPALEREYQFWMQNRSVSLEKNGRKRVLNRYNAQVNSPRCVWDQWRFANVTAVESNISQLTLSLLPGLNPTQTIWN